MGEITTLAQALQQYGPWALVAIQFFAIAWMAKVILSNHKERIEGDAAQAKILMGLIERETTSNIEMKGAISKLGDALVAMERRLENVEKETARRDPR